MASVAKPLLKVALPDNKVYTELTLRDPLQPLSWTVSGPPSAGSADRSLIEDAATFFQDMVGSHGRSLDLIYVSIAQDADGRHRFIQLLAAQRALEAAILEGKQSAASSLPVVSEGEVKALREKLDVLLLYARADSAAAEEPPDDLAVGGRGVVPGGDRTLLAPERPLIRPVDEMCPHKRPYACNYSVIVDCSLGNTQRLILCDEAVLCRDNPEEPIFDHLRLIVNCHESRASAGKYRVGSCSSSQPPAVIFQAVHEWYSMGVANQNQVNDQMQQAIWEHLQRGSVAVHCLAGIHRAACIVACHFLWRYYVLGHSEIPSSAAEIYRRLKAVRPAVSPAYTHILTGYEAHLKKRACQTRGGA